MPISVNFLWTAYFVIHYEQHIIIIIIIIIEDNFHELMEVIKVFKGKLDKDNIDRQIISSFWTICHLSRVWGVEQNGMLRQNNLISDTQIELLSNWTDCITYTIMNLLEGLPDDEVFEIYKFYLEDNNEKTAD